MSDVRVGTSAIYYSLYYANRKYIKVVFLQLIDGKSVA